MAKYVAFLKAINVGGHVVKMDTLRELFSAMKFSNVETFIASGNVIFDTKATPDEKLEQQIEQHLKKALATKWRPSSGRSKKFRRSASISRFRTELLKTAHAVHVGLMRSACPRHPRKSQGLRGRRRRFSCFRTRGVLAVPLLDRGFEIPKLFEKIAGQTATYRNVNTMVRLTKKYSH